MQGDSRNDGIDLRDFTYDGVLTEKGQLKGGLGQLTDMEEGVLEDANEDAVLLQDTESFDKNDFETLAAKGGFLRSPGGYRVSGQEEDDFSSHELSEDSFDVEENVGINASNHSSPFYRWVGWNNHSAPFVSIWFAFEHVRNFSQMRFANF